MKEKKKKENLNKKKSKVQTWKEMQEGTQVIDLTCPFLRNIQHYQKFLHTNC